MWLLSKFLHLLKTAWVLLVVVNKRGGGCLQPNKWEHALSTLKAPWSLVIMGPACSCFPTSGSDAQAWRGLPGYCAERWEVLCTTSNVDTKWISSILSVFYIRMLELVQFFLHSIQILFIFFLSPLVFFLFLNHLFVLIPLTFRPFLLFLFIIWSRISFTPWPKLTLNLWLSCLSLLSNGMMKMNHHACVLSASTGSFPVSVHLDFRHHLQFLSEKRRRK